MAGEHAHGGKHAGRRRKDHAADAERGGEVAGVHRAGAAEGQQSQVARIEAVTVDQVNAAARTYLQKKRAVVGTLLPASAETSAEAKAPEGSPAASGAVDPTAGAPVPGDTRS